MCISLVLCNFGVMKKIFLQFKCWLTGLSFKTGVIVLILCILCYVISFAQALLPLSLGLKGSLWVVFFGLAKAFQYSAILIIGKEGFRKLKNRFRSKVEITE